MGEKMIPISKVRVYEVATLKEIREQRPVVLAEVLAALSLTSAPEVEAPKAEKPEVPSVTTLRALVGAKAAPTIREAFLAA